MRLRIRKHDLNGLESGLETLQNLLRMLPAVKEIENEPADCARVRGHADEKISEVRELVAGYKGYTFCNAHSTAYGVEKYRAAWLKRYFAAEFMAAIEGRQQRTIICSASVSRLQK